MSVTALLMISNYHWGDQQNYASNWAVVLIVTLVLESHLYIMTRAQVQLYVRLATIQQQEQQLSDLLDMVPESVLICTKDAEHERSKGVFANF